ncbi:MAG: hypothetical protein GQ534_10170 [Candidatus Delongbacteria bacterium]|nr:hypothetical protein [Candidatus Delongbacteria bacterium]
MKKLNYFLMSLIIFSSMIFYSCHTETPVNVDYESPEITIQMIYNSTDTLFNSQDSTITYTDFEHKIEEENGDHYFVVSAEDNGNLYSVTLFAEDEIAGISYQIESKSINSDGEVIFVITLENFPIVQGSNPQRFYLYFLVSDDTDNTSITTKLGIKVGKLFIQEKLYNEFGLLSNTEGDPIDFREKVEELTFFQFLAKG